MSSFAIRPATLEDVAAIARHRAAMFRDMGQLAAADVEPLEGATAAWLRLAMPAGEYLGWLATPATDPSHVIGGAGMQIRPLIPRPDRSGRGILEGRQGLIVNVYVNHEHRRCGIARALTEAAIAWGRDAGLASMVLHASAEGRPLYDALGFVPTNEMRYAGR